MTLPRQQSGKPHGIIYQGTIVRRASADDIGAVIQLAAMSSMSARWPSAAAMTYCAAEESGIALQAKAMFVACAAGQALFDVDSSDVSGPSGCIIGFAAFSAITGAVSGECILENLAVVETSRKQGIGSQLLVAGLLWCRAQFGSSVWLEVRASNRNAIALYERIGFTVAGRRPGYYKQPDEDAVEMRKVLDTSAAGC